MRLAVPLPAAPPVLRRPGLAGDLEVDRTVGAQRVEPLPDAARGALRVLDDPGERETAPPYDAPLRGIQVTLRAYEPDSRQVRQVNVKQTFVPK